MNQMCPFRHYKTVFDFIKREIFKSGKIFSQELSLSPDRKIFALCDLSDKESVLEIKTFPICFDDATISPWLAQQLYYESNGRKTFVLSIDFVEHKNKKGKYIIDAIHVRIYSIKLEETVPKPYEGIRTLQNNEIAILNLIKANPSISNVEIGRQIERRPDKVGKIIKALKEMKYIVKEDESKRNSKWILLRNPEDTKTRWSTFNGETTWIIDANNPTPDSQKVE